MLHFSPVRGALNFPAWAYKYRSGIQIAAGKTLYGETILEFLLLIHFILHRATPASNSPPIKQLPTMSSTPRLECADIDPSPLGQPLQFAFSGRVAPNRFLKGAMSERLASFSFKDVDSRGIPTPTLIQAYKSWGEAQIGINLTGNVMIDPGHLEAAGNPVIPQHAEFSGERFERFREMASAGKAKGMLIVAQVGHPGRQTQMYLQPNPISASDVQVKGDPMGMKFAKPRAATQEDIANIIDSFAHAAEYLDKAGFDGIQLHGAHGYLLSQFLSPTTNLRTDQYGGDLKNRMRLILEVRDEIAKRVRKDFVVGIKINSVEFQEKGFQPDEAKVLCQALEEHAFDFVELSGGTYENWPLATQKRASTLDREAVSFALPRSHLCLWSSSNSE